jgi:hypothetical protein
VPSVVLTSIHLNFSCFSARQNRTLKNKIQLNKINAEQDRSWHSNELKKKYKHREGKSQTEKFSASGFHHHTRIDQAEANSWGEGGGIVGRFLLEIVQKTRSKVTFTI